MKQHLIPAVIAAVVAGAIAIGFAHYAPVEQVTKVEQVTHQVSASKHAWPDMTAAEKKQFSELARDLPAGIKVDIVCNDAGCSDLAADIDDALEDAGIGSSIDKAIGPLGYGIGVQTNEFDKNAADVVRNILSASTGLQPVVAPGTSPPGYVSIIIGKRPRN